MIASLRNRIRKSQNDSGFTLIELLIVIIILGILAAIVVFAVGSTRKDAVNASCKTNVKSVQLGLEAIKTKSGSYPASKDDALTGSTAGATNGAVLKTWPGGDAATDEFYFTYAQTGSGTGYTLGVDGKNLPTTSLTPSASDDAVETACTST